MRKSIIFSFFLLFIVPICSLGQERLQVGPDGSLRFGYIETNLRVSNSAQKYLEDISVSDITMLESGDTLSVGGYQATFEMLSLFKYKKGIIANDGLIIQGGNIIDTTGPYLKGTEEKIAFFMIFMMIAVAFMLCSSIFFLVKK